MSVKEREVYVRDDGRTVVVCVVWGERVQVADVHTLRRYCTTASTLLMTYDKAGIAKANRAHRALVAATRKAWKTKPLSARRKAGVK